MLRALQGIGSHKLLTPALCTSLVLCNSEVALRLRWVWKEDLERRAIDKGTLLETIKRVDSEPRGVEVEILRLWNLAQ